MDYNYWKVGISMNQSVQKAFSILDLFIDDRELSLQEIALKANIPKPTAYRLLTTLENRGILYKVKENPHDSRYGLGLKLLEFGNLVSERLELREIALPYMEELAEEVNEVVHLVVAYQLEAAYIEKVNSKRALSLHTKIGRSTPLYVGSGPKMLLAFLDEKKREQVLQGEEFVTLRNQAIDKDLLVKELTEIRENEFSVSVGEQDADTTGVSFPIYNHEEQVIAALAISGLSSRFTGERLAFIKRCGKKISSEISKKLGSKKQTNV